jgi:hypothetical protein
VARLHLKTVALREDGCFSAMLWDNRPFAVSVERTFELLRTVIRNGKYTCKRTTRFEGDPPYPTFEVIVPGHTRILFHKGNIEAHSLGCVLVAESFGMLDGVTSVMESNKGFDEFMSLAGSLDEFEMEVSGR